MPYKRHFAGYSVRFAVISPRTIRAPEIPMPRKLKEDSVMIALEILVVAAIMIVGSTEGMRWRKIIFNSGTPEKSAYKTYSLSLMDMISARTSRAISIQEKKPMTIIMELKPCLKKILMTVTRISQGMDWSTSTKRIRMASTIPPR